MTSSTLGPDFVPPAPRRRSGSRATGSTPAPGRADVPSDEPPDAPTAAAVEGETTDDGPAPLIPPLPERRSTIRAKGQPARRSVFLVATAVVLLAAMMLYVYGTLTLSKGSELPNWGPVLLPFFVAATFMIVRRAGREETRFDLRGIMMLGFALRAIGAYLRFAAPVDALIYHQEGSRIAPELREFNFWVDTGRTVPGTGWIRLVSGMSHAFLLDDMFATFLVFTFMAFIGTYLCYQAFRFAVPDGDHKRYALLLFLWPSLVYWPSSIGKEAWMILGIGIAAWGVSRVVTGHASIGLPVFAVGLIAVSLVRPHIALMIMVGFAISLLARPGGRSSFRMFGRLFSILLLLVGGSLIAGRTAELLKVDSDGTEAISAGLDLAQAKTEQGGASFSPAVVKNPVDYPAAFVTVWFRPFPWEAKGGGGEGASTQLLSAAENIFLLLLFIVSWRRLLALPRALTRIPYVAFAVTYSIVFVYAFAVIGNFGILARQRTQGTLLFFVILCIPVIEPARRSPMGWRDAARARLHRSDGAIATTADAATATDPSDDTDTGSAVSTGDAERPITPPRTPRPTRAGRRAAKTANRSR